MSVPQSWGALQLAPGGHQQRHQTKGAAKGKEGRQVDSPAACSQLPTPAHLEAKVVIVKVTVIDNLAVQLVGILWGSSRGSSERGD